MRDVPHEVSPVLTVLTEAQGLGFLGPGPVGRHVEHARAMARCLPGGVSRCLDLGSGGGVPGLVIALERPEAVLVLLDARERRCAFLRQAVERIGVAGRVEVVEERAETAARRREFREQFDAVVARSFGLPAVTAECAAGFLLVGGTLVVSEPPDTSAMPSAQDLPPRAPRWPEAGLDRLGFGPTEPCGDPDASFVLCRKRRLDDRWPRRVGIPAKRPVWED